MTRRPSNYVVSINGARGHEFEHLACAEAMKAHIDQMAEGMLTVTVEPIAHCPMCGGAVEVTIDPRGRLVFEAWG